MITQLNGVLCQVSVLIMVVIRVNKGLYLHQSQLSTFVETQGKNSNSGQRGKWT